MFTETTALNNQAAVLPASQEAAKSCGLQTVSSNINVDQVRELFPIFSEQADVILFDNAATTQKPKAVIDAMSEFYSSSCANAGRASYRWSTQAANAIEESRKSVASFINALPDELAFTSGATDSLNLLALSWGLTNLKDGDEILLCPQDHKSAVLPWYNVARLLTARDINVSIKEFNIHEVGDYDLKSIKTAVSGRTRLLAMSHIHHVFGLDMEVPEIRQIIGPDVRISLDASQSAGHIPLDVRSLDVDFLSFSGHKMFAANGSGVLWVNPKRLEELTNMRVGGGSADGERKVSQFFEAGTPNIPAIISMRPAIDFLKTLGMENVEARVSELTKKLYAGLNGLPGLEFAPGPGVCGCPGGNGIIAFRFEQVSSSDLGFLLDSENIFVRANDHCLAKRGEGDDYIRVSLHMYNTEAEIDQFLEVLDANVC